MHFFFKEKLNKVFITLGFLKFKQTYIWNKFGGHPQMLSRLREGRFMIIMPDLKRYI